jgi:hypothetical protein
MDLLAREHRPAAEVHAVTVLTSRDRPSEAQRYPLLAHIRKHREKIGHPEKLPDPRSEIDELKAASRRLCRDIKPHQRPQAHAVHVRQIGEIEHNALAFWDQLFDLGGELIAHPIDQLAMAMHSHQITLALNIKS